MKNRSILEPGQIEARYEELRENEDGLDEVEPIISIWLLGVWGGLCGSPGREDDAPVPFRDGDGEASLFLFRRGLFFVRMGD